MLEALSAVAFQSANLWVKSAATLQRSDEGDFKGEGLVHNRS